MSGLYTPGPWAQGLHTEYKHVVFANGVPLAVAEQGHLANARLIAAAPNLLAACEAALDELAGYEDVEDGPDGPRPNRAMHAANLLREAVERAGGAS